jgi:Family of unknown function (DUF6580)
VKPKPTFWLPIALMFVFALTRWPGLLPDNFSAAYALAFCAGVYFRGSLAWWLPLGTMLASNILLNAFYYHFPILDSYMVFTLFAFACVIGLGRFFRPDSSLGKLVLGGLLGAILFYLVSNTMAWIFEPTQPYPKSVSGWIQALTTGTPGWPETWKFFRNTLLSSGLFSALFVGSMKAVQKAEQTETEEAEETPEEESQPDQPEESKA